MQNAAPYSMKANVIVGFDLRGCSKGGQFPRYFWMLRKLKKQQYWGIRNTVWEDSRILEIF